MSCNVIINGIKFTMTMKPPFNGTHYFLNYKLKLIGFLCIFCIICLHLLLEADGNFKAILLSYFVPLKYQILVIKT